MRILIAYFFDERYIPLGYAIRDGFRRLGHEAFCFDTAQEHMLWRGLLKPVSSLKRRLSLPVGFERNGAFGREGYKRRLFFRQLAAVRPEIVVVLRAHQFLRPEDFRRAREEFGVRGIVGWNVEGPNVLFSLDSEARDYDAYFSMHLYGAHTAKVGRLPVWATDERRYRRNVTLFAQRSPNPVLVSGWNPRRHQWAQALAEGRVSIYGRWSPRVREIPELLPFVRNEGCWGERLCDLYNASAVALNIQGWDPALDPCCNLRVADIPSCGSLFLSEYSEELADIYRIGREADSFRSPEEMLDKLRFYSRYPEVGARMAERGYRRACTLPSYKERARTLIAHVR